MVYLVHTPALGMLPCVLLWLSVFRKQIADRRTLGPYSLLGLCWFRAANLICLLVLSVRYEVESSLMSLLGSYSLSFSGVDHGVAPSQP